MSLRSSSSRLLAVSLLASLTTSGCFLWGRPNPQIAKIKYPDGSTDKLSYDDGGYLTKVSVADEDIKLTWKDGRLLAHTVDDRKVELDYDDAGRLSSANSNDDPITKYAFGYDDAGRISTLKTTQDEGEAGKFVLDYAFDYDDSGAMVGVELTQTITSGGETSKSTNAIEQEFEGNRLVKTTQSNEDSDNETINTYSYDDNGRLEKRVSTTKGSGETSSEFTSSYDYDDEGRVQTVTSKLKGGDTESETEYVYGDGDAHGLDITPGGLFGFFDVKGNSYTTFDNSGVVRLTGLGW